LSQQTRSETSTSIWVRDEKTGESIVGLHLDAEAGVRGVNGKLFAQKGNGEVVVIEDPISLFAQLYDVAFQAGRKFQREKGGHE
jgi:hypothetical protein